MTTADLLVELEQRGVRIEAHGDRLRYAPRSAVTDGLLEQLKLHKAELLALLRPTRDIVSVPPVAVQDAPAKPTKPVCRCGSTTWRDVSIHDGQSVRRDCGRFIEFPIWYGKGTLQNEK